MSFVLYNSLTGKKEPFRPLNPPQVSMYCCGPTVYDLLHIGNFRGAVVFNFLCQWLKHQGYKVTYAYNFTDVDDKILNRARQEQKSMKEVADHYIAEFKKDFKALGLEEHDHNPQATHFIPDMIKLISTLLEKGKAYRVGGDLFFSVQSLAGYGKLSGRKQEELLSGARVEVDEKKRYPGDFALWKSCGEEEPGWDSPWGRGRPGWHLECTTMIFSLLGQNIDIHGGGVDLLFPHHENEMAQAEGAMENPTPFVKYWVHNNMFTFGGEKMAKSTGNVHIMRDFLKEYKGEIFKYMVLSSHYRSPAEVSENKILLCVQALSRIYTFLRTADSLSGATALSGASSLPTAKKGLSSSAEERALGPAHQGVKTEDHLTLAEEAILRHLNDDLNTPAVLSVLFTQIRRFNEEQSRKKMPHRELAFYAQGIKNLILKYGKIMSLFQEPPVAFLKEMDDIFLKKHQISRKEIQRLVEQREKARQDKDFKKADQIRLRLLDMHIEVQDRPEGTTWETKK